ncbi:MAG TPA: phosphoribosyltransferase family protein, partial [Candidatus Limnocylindrales bacterium]|nr:phosphoribosyltransferase family protein [Candidatus Limnocylindrales bacterium]
MAEQAKTIVSWEDLDGLVGELADKVGTDYDVALVITRGGLVPAGMLAYRLGLRDILVAAVAFYDDDGRTSEQPTFFQFPSDPLLHGKRVLVVDEVWDTGTTIAAVVERVEMAGGRPTTAVLHY